MRFSKGYGNSFLLINCIILSVMIANILLNLKYSLAESYLISSGISISLFVIISFISYFIIKRYKKCTGIPLTKATSVVMGTNIDYQVTVDGKVENVTCYQTSFDAKIYENETLYLSKKGKLFREKSIMIYPPTIMLIILAIGIGFIILGFRIDEILLDLKIILPKLPINEAMKEVVLFKFCNFFLFGAILLLYTAIHETLIGKNKVEATIIKSEEVEIEEEIPGHLKYHDFNVDRIVYRYVWKGEVRIFTPLINNAHDKKVGTIIKINVDNNGDVVRESMDVAFLFLGAFMMIIFYVVLLFTFLTELF